MLLHSPASLSAVHCTTECWTLHLLKPITKFFTPNSTNSMTDSLHYSTFKFQQCKSIFTKHQLLYTFTTFCLTYVICLHVKYLVYHSSTHADIHNTMQSCRIMQVDNTCWTAVTISVTPEQHCQLYKRILHKLWKTMRQIQQCIYHKLGTSALCGIFHIFPKGVHITYFSA